MSPKGVQPVREDEPVAWPEPKQPRRKPGTPRPCPRCKTARPIAIEVIVQAREFDRGQRPMKHYGSRARRLCEVCALEVFEAATVAMDADS